MADSKVEESALFSPQQNSEEFSISYLDGNQKGRAWLEYVYTTDIHVSYL